MTSYFLHKISSKKIGKTTRCYKNADVCEIEIRKQAGKVENISIGCKDWVQNILTKPFKNDFYIFSLCSPQKAIDACENNKQHNSKGNWGEQQCKPWKWYQVGTF